MAIAPKKSRALHEQHRRHHRIRSKAWICATISTARPRFVAALDLVLSAPTAAAATAASVGAEVWFLTAGRTWPQLGTDEYPWYAKTQGVFAGEIRRLGRR